MVTLEATEQPKPLSEEGLLQFIAKALDKGWVRESFHSDVERATRNISHDDLLHGLEAPWLLGEVRYSESHDNFTYAIKTVDIEGDELCIVVCPVQSNQTLKVVTKW
jgi:hypothetical protein